VKNRVSKFLPFKCNLQRYNPEVLRQTQEQSEELLKKVAGELVEVGLALPGVKRLVTLTMLAIIKWCSAAGCI
jgi:hypothetical protein